MDDRAFLEIAVDVSRESVILGGFPVGAIIVREGEIISRGVSNGKQLKDPTSHAEIAAIRDACQKLQRQSLKDAVLYSSMEPCLMCFAAATWASVPRIVYACGRARVGEEHFEGAHDVPALNARARKPIEFLHITTLEETAAQVISEWKTESSR
ncbi:nucleoside deaminase [Patescibacteria group bacterium]|nr:MAG: nucleoside deaminase [Patescibacteria group bacterium]